MAKFQNKLRALRRMAALPVEIRAAAKLQLQLNANQLAGAIERVVPVDEGDLRESINVRDKSGLTKIRYTVTAGEGGQKEKARAQEFGRPDQAAQPFFFPTYRANKRRLSRQLAKAIRRGAEKAVSK